MNRSFWDRISTIGLGEENMMLAARANRLANQVNFSLLMVLTLLNAFIIYFVIANNSVYNIYGFRLLILEFLLLMNVGFAFKKQFQAIKAILIFTPVFTTVLLPTFLGKVQTSSFFYYHFIVLGFSMVPTIVLIPGKQKRYYLLSIFYFSIIMYFLDDLLFWGTQSDEKVKAIISNFRIFYKIIPFSLFIFLQLALFYLRNITSEYESTILNANLKLASNVQELEQMQTHLVQSEKMVSMGTMVAGIAHEINNPLNHINGGIMMIRNELKDIPDEYVKQGMDMIDGGVRRATDIVQTMKKISYNGPITFAPTDLNQVIKDCLVFINHSLSEDIQVDSKLALKGKISINADQIQQVVINILENAIHAVNSTSDPSKIITIETGTEQKNGINYSFMRFHNNGPSIPDEILAQIFDPFFTTKEPGEGTGLGLWICYSLINHHNGTLSVQNTASGVLFSVLLPSE